jgi:hypothetical protein
MNLRLGFGAAGLFLAMTFVAACSGDVACSQASPRYTIVGKLIARHGSTATFSVESVEPPVSPPPPGVVAPAVVRGQKLDVGYPSDHADFLRVGKRYRVELFGGRPGPFQSDVHTADVACSRGTVYADGREIDTSLRSRSLVRHLVEGAALLFLVIVPVTTGLVVRARSRRNAVDPR